MAVVDRYMYIYGQLCGAYHNLYVCMCVCVCVCVCKHACETGFSTYTLELGSFTFLHSTSMLLSDQVTRVLFNVVTIRIDVSSINRTLLGLSQMSHLCI